MPEPEPRVLREPSPAPTGSTPRGSIWMRGLMMLVFAVLLGLAQTVLQVLALVQFILMLLNGGKPNAQIAGFGKSLAPWMAKTAAFLTADSEAKPWPFEG
jgi:hypothetical protein